MGNELLITPERYLFLPVKPEQTNLVLKAAFNIHREHDGVSDIWSAAGRGLAATLSARSSVLWTSREQGGTPGCAQRIVSWAPAPLLFGSPVRVHAGQGHQEPGRESRGLETAEVWGEGWVTQLRGAGARPQAAHAALELIPWPEPGCCGLPRSCAPFLL